MFIFIFKDIDKQAFSSDDLIYHCFFLFHKFSEHMHICASGTESIIMHICSGVEKPSCNASVHEQTLDGNTCSYPHIRREGKPVFENGDVHFSLSHSGAVTVVAMGNRPCGVDVERIRPINYGSFTFMGKFASDEEFFREWVTREARAKYTGEGLSAVRKSVQPPNTYTFVLPCFKGYALAICV